jgi:hypothetical protein
MPAAGRQIALPPGSAAVPRVIDWRDTPPPSRLHPGRAACRQSEVVGHALLSSMGNSWRGLRRWRLRAHLSPDPREAHAGRPGMLESVDSWSPGHGSRHTHTWGQADASTRPRPRRGRRLADRSPLQGRPCSWRPPPSWAHSRSSAACLTGTEAGRRISDGATGWVQAPRPSRDSSLPVGVAVSPSNLHSAPGRRRPSEGTVAAAPVSPTGSWGQGSYLVDPASSHMLVSKIKPCMSKYKQTIQ